MYLLTGRKYALMALAIILFGWMASVRRKNSLGTSPFSRWPALSVIRGVECIARAAYTVDVGHQRVSGIIVVGALLQIGQGGWVSSLVLSRCL